MPSLVGGWDHFHSRLLWPPRRANHGVLGEEDGGCTVLRGAASGTERLSLNFMPSWPDRPLIPLFYTDRATLRGRSLG